MSWIEGLRLDDGEWWLVVFDADHPGVKCSLNGTQAVEVTSNIKRMDLAVGDDSFTCKVTFRTGVESILIPFNAIFRASHIKGACCGCSRVFLRTQLAIDTSRAYLLGTEPYVYCEACTRQGDDGAQALDALIYGALEDAASLLKRITTLMEEQSVSFDDLSKLTDIDVADLRHWIANGAAEAFDLEALLRVLGALGTTLICAPPKESTA